MPRTLTPAPPRTRSRSRARSQSRGRGRQEGTAEQPAARRDTPDPAGPSKPRGRSQTRKPKAKSRQPTPQAVQHGEEEIQQPPGPPFAQLAYAQTQETVRLLRAQVEDLQRRLEVVERQNVDLRATVRAIGKCNYALPDIFILSLILYA